MRKHRPDTKSPRSPSLSPEEEERLRSLLQTSLETSLSQVKNLVGSPRVAQAFLERLPWNAPAGLELVFAVKRAFTEKDVQKAAKRALFRMKQHGIKVPYEDAQAASEFLMKGVDKPEDPRAFIGPPDGFGNRAVLLNIPRVPTGVDLGMGVVSDDKGMVEFVFGRFSKKRANEMKERFLDQVNPTVETSLAHVATVLESSYSIKSGNERAVRDYLQLRPQLLAEVSLLNRPVVYEVLSPESVNEVLTDSQCEALLSHERMKTWIIEPEAISPLLEELIKVEESLILISAEQKADRTRDLKEAHLPKIFTDERIALLKGRLEEAAFVYYKEGEESFARTALGAALTLGRSKPSLSLNPFLRLMLERSLRFYLVSNHSPQGHKTPIESPSGLILPK